MSTAAAPANALNFDIELLLRPVSEKNPAGEDLRLVPIDGKSKLLLAEVEERRKLIISGKRENLEPRNDSMDAAAAEQEAAALTEQRRREWREIEKMLTAGFAKGKDLGAAVTLAQAAVNCQGWAALRPCLQFIRLLHQRFGETLYPLPEKEDDGHVDFTTRLAALGRLDHENCLPGAIRQLPLTDPRAGMAFSLAHYEQVQILREKQPTKEADPASRRRMIEEKQKALDDAVTKSKAGFFRTLLQTIQDAADELSTLRSFVDEVYAASPEEDRPSFLETSEALEHCHGLVSQYLSKTDTEPKTAAEPSAEPLEAADAQTGSTRREVLSGGDVVQLLEQALAELRLHQRHNPAAYLVEEAIRWTKLPIADWYLEAAEDTSMAGFISKLMKRGKP
jgi:type VI secretion system protein ImpA